MRTDWFTAAVIATVAAAPLAAIASPRATITEHSGNVSLGTIILDASPAEVYALITDYATWPKFLSDVKWTQIKSGGRRDARVRMYTYSLGHKVTLAFDNIDGRLIRFSLADGPPGARASGEYVLDPINNGTRTRINAALYMDVVGAPGLLFSNSKIRKMRQAKLRADLEDGAKEIERRAKAARMNVGLTSG